MDYLEIAKVCHEAIRTICEYNGDNSVKPWCDAEEWQRQSALDGVAKHHLAYLQCRELSPSDTHDAWMLSKLNDGWMYGPEKNGVLKTHPCLVPYAELPEFQLMGYYDNKVLGKDFVKKWGEKTVFSYGCPNGNFDVKVYRITRTSPDGMVTELTWEQVKKRCKELGIKHVTELFQCKIGGIWNLEKNGVWCQVNIFPEILLEEVDRLANEPDDHHVREGVCVRVEHEGNMQVYKHKGFEYKVLEGMIEFDPEEAS